MAVVSISVLNLGVLQFIYVLWKSRNHYLSDISYLAFSFYTLEPILGLFLSSVVCSIYLFNYNLRYSLSIQL